MRFAKYIAVFVAFLVATSCVETDTDMRGDWHGTTSVGGNVVQIQGRVVRFVDEEVTRASKDPELGETRVTNMAVALFPIQDDEIQSCVYYEYKTGSNLIFTIDRGLPVFNGYDDEPFAMYIFANISDMPKEMPKDDPFTLDELQAYTHDVTTNYVTSVPASGFPMMGSLGDYTKGEDDPYDGKTFILKPSKVEGNENGLPTVNGNPTDYLPVPMPAMYAKFSFEISLESEQHVEGGVTPKFSMESYVVNNIPAKVAYDESLNDESQGVLSDSRVVNYSGVAESSSITFDFYVPERFLEPATSAEEFPYPFGEDGGADIIGYSNLREEDKIYAQRYKGLLLGDNQKATYITINGSYRTHQDHKYNVSYDIYLGEDSYGNFNIKRNKYYLNKVVIKGLTASSNQSIDGDVVSIDHRVNANTSSHPLIISFRRETLLDSHFEVRPLRVRLNPIYLDDANNPISGAKVTVQLLNADLSNNTIPDWVRIEHNNGTGSATQTHCANGKRKYFTTNLVTGTLESSGKIISDISLENSEGENIAQTFWIYVDENTAIREDKDSNGAYEDDEAVRAARIRITYSDNTRKVYEPIDYVINQQHLFPVATTRKAEEVEAGAAQNATYYIENHEEYLYNYDSEDNHGQSEWNGIEWGLDGIQLSHTIDAGYVDFSVGFWGSILAILGWNQKEIAQEVFNNLNIKYDFYSWRDVKDYAGLRDAEPKKYSMFNGYEYNSNIIDYLKTTPEYSNDPKAKVEYIQLDEEPVSAIAYCYNKNKRNELGVVENVVWYLPSIEEVEDIAEFAYAEFDGIFQGSYYWSCQPSYLANNLNLELWKYDLSKRAWGNTGNQVTGYYYTEDTSHARSTRALKTYNEETGKWEFAGVVSSGSDEYGVQGGQLRINEIPFFTDVYVQDIDANHYTKNINFDYNNHPANQARTGVRARVRCVRKM